MYRLTGANNTNLPTIDFPMGQIRDTSETIDGTSLYTILFQDIQHNLQRIAEKGGDESPDNSVDGELPVLPGAIHNYQFLDTFAKMISKTVAGNWSDRFGETIIGDILGFDFKLKTGQKLVESIISYGQRWNFNTYPPVIRPGFVYDPKFKYLIALTTIQNVFNVRIGYWNMIGEWQRRGLPSLFTSNILIAAADGFVYYTRNNQMWALDIEQNVQTAVVFYGLIARVREGCSGFTAASTDVFVPYLSNRTIARVRGVDLVWEKEYEGRGTSEHLSIAYDEINNRLYQAFEDNWIHVLDADTLEVLDRWQTNQNFNGIQVLGNEIFIIGTVSIVTYTLDGIQKNIIAAPNPDGNLQPYILRTNLGLYVRDDTGFYNIKRTIAFE